MIDETKDLEQELESVESKIEALAEEVDEIGAKAEIKSKRNKKQSHTVAGGMQSHKKFDKFKKGNK